MATIIYLGLVIFFIGFLSHIIAILGRSLFGEDIHRAVNRKLPAWWDRASEMLGKKPEGLSVLGLLFTILWPCLISLNILLLAQLFELIIPFGGVRINLVYFGSYNLSCIVVAILFALAQTSFGIIYEASGSKGKKIWFIVIALTILFEMALSAYRSWLLTSGMEIVTPTPWDMIMLKGGPLLGAIIGFIIPFAEVATGTRAFNNFIEPLVKTIPSLLWGVITLVWCVIAWWIFPKIFVLPTSMKFLKKDYMEIFNGLDLLDDSLTRLGQKVNKIGDTSEGRDSLRDRVSKLEKNINDEKGKLDQRYKNVQDSITNSGRNELRRIKRSIRDLKTSLNVYNRAWKGNSNQAFNDVREGCIKLREWIRYITRCRSDFDNINNKFIEIKDKYQNLKNQAQDIIAFLNDPDNYHPKGLPEFVIRIFRELINTSAHDELTRCGRIAQEIVGLNGRMERLENYIENINNKLPTNILPSPSRAEEQNLLQKNYIIEKDIPIDKDGRKYQHRIKDLKDDLRDRAKELGITWFRRVLICFILMVISAQLSGCDLISKMIEKGIKPQFVIVLVDESGSFALNYGGVRTHLWPDAIYWGSYIAESLNPGDAYAIIGIDGHGFDTDDIRINIQVIDENQIKARTQKRNLKKQVQGLTRRENASSVDANYTDIIGALSHSEYLLRNMGQKYQGIIVIISDMVQTARDIGTEFSFPDGTMGYCFFVNATGRSQWADLIKKWNTIFENINLDVKKPDGTIHFYQKADSPQNLSSIFQSR